MIRLERSKDYRLIRDIITHPRLYPWIKSDDHPPAEKFWPAETDTIHYMLAYNDAELLGVVMVHPIHTLATWEIHHCIMPIGWPSVDKIAEEVFLYLWTETPCQTAVGFTPVCNKLACRFALRVGMHKVGVISNGYRKDGRLYDIMVTERTLECHLQQQERV